MTLAWGAKVRGRWRHLGPIFFRPLRVKGLFCARTGRAAFLFRRNSGECEIERKHLTLRTPIKRLVRKIICFSKSRQIHDIVIGLFVNRYAFGRAV
jgi:hypothetical protein